MMKLEIPDGCVFCEKCKYFDEERLGYKSSGELRHVCNHQSNLRTALGAIRPKVVRMQSCEDLNIKNDCKNYKKRGIFF